MFILPIQSQKFFPDFKLFPSYIVILFQHGNHHLSLTLCNNLGHARIMNDEWIKPVQFLAAILHSVMLASIYSMAVPKI